MTYNKDTYCEIAFTGFDTRTKSVCCWAKFNTTFNSYTEAMASAEVKALQQDLLTGIQNPICNSCWGQEKVGITSMRRSEYTSDLTDKKLKYLIIDSGNVCNLACRTCNYTYSSSHIKEYEYRHNTKVNLIKKTDIEYLKTEDYSNLKFVSILGGEPFQNLDHLEILEIIVNQGHAKNCSLSYVTNGTVPLSGKIRKLFSEFKDVGLVLSVDATESQFEYIRTNGNWTTLTNNIDTFKDCNLRGHPTVSALNVLYLEELFQWYADNNIPVDIVFCDDPVHYSFNIFNDTQKSILIDHLKQSRFDMGAIIHKIIQSIFNKDALTKFNSEINFTKDFKKLDAAIYLPRLINLLNS